MRIERELMRGAGPIAVMKLLSRGPMYGYELVQSLATKSAGVLDMGQSTLYPMLYNMEAKKLVAAYWETADSGRQRKYYKLTDKGKKRLAADLKQWEALAGAMNGLGILSLGAPGATMGGAA